MNPPLQWLLSGPAWVTYRTRLDLLHQDPGDALVVQARQDMLADPQVQFVIAGLADWPGTVLSSHKSAGQAYHRLNFLTDLGLTAADPGLGAIVERILSSQSEQGPFALPMNIGAAYGGDGQDRLAWALCDAPLQVYALIRLGLGDHPAVQKALGFLTGLVRENGWPCAVSPELGSWRGPGRKGDPCPYANLAMLKALGQMDELRSSPAAETGVQTLLTLWEQRQDQHPYIFYMGTDFCKLKAPLVWYDLLHVLDALSLFPAARSDPRFANMLDIALQKADAEGHFTPESVWMQWKDWEFGQKKLPSRWITLLLWRVQERLKVSPA
ncbi:MAG: hypothetical protein JW987_10120 [Anaerolineaceae bacterium]|nr:hypothetical protein [Anaerolineaceae bacterium]